MRCFACSRASTDWRCCESNGPTPCTRNASLQYLRPALLLCLTRSDSAPLPASRPSRRGLMDWDSQDQAFFTYGGDTCVTPRCTHFRRALLATVAQAALTAAPSRPAGDSAPDGLRTVRTVVIIASIHLRCRTLLVPSSALRASRLGQTGGAISEYPGLFDAGQDHWDEWPVYFKRHFNVPRRPFWHSRSCRCWAT